MNKQSIISDLEADFGINCDVNADFNDLCDGESCRSANCTCWDALRTQVSDHLKLKAVVRPTPEPLSHSIFGAVCVVVIMTMIYALLTLSNPAANPRSPIATAQMEVQK